VKALDLALGLRVVGLAVLDGDAEPEQFGLKGSSEPVAGLSGEYEPVISEEGRRISPDLS
jgi:hypothetical protein